ncbi:MAG: acyl carrier protein [Desulfotomaculum sp.]|nr:acyl carrier protein [Desulfotomaculum sp.]MCL0032371.1 acyl carrier protein [Peptococcaceae bacterium]
MDDIFERMQRIIVEQLDIEKDQVTLNSSFVDDLGADSLDIVELVMAMEEEFDMQIPDEEAERIRTVGDAVKFVQQKMQ